MRWLGLGLGTLTRRFKVLTQLHLIDVGTLQLCCFIGEGLDLDKVKVRVRVRVRMFGFGFGSGLELG